MRHGISSAMATRFEAVRDIQSVDDLSASERDQLVAAGKAWDGEARSAEERLEPGGEEGPSFHGFCQLWRVADGERHLYDAWFYMVDSGTIFKAGTTEVVAEIIQFGLECRDPATRTELGMAMVEAKLLPTVDGSYAEFAAALKARP